MERIEFPAAIAVYFLIALVLPTLRVWRKHRIWPLVFHREANPIARAMGLLFGAFLIVLMVWAILYWLLAPPAIGIWAAPDWVAGLGRFFQLRRLRGRRTGFIRRAGLAGLRV